MSLIAQASDSRSPVLTLPNLQRPIAIRPNFDNFPSELKALRNWVNWRYLSPTSSGGKWRKVPFQPTGKTADTTNPSTWNSFEDCRDAYTRGGFDGVGFVFDGAISNDGLCYAGVDFDRCIVSCDGKAKLTSPARDRINRLKTYTEVSVSGFGFHCITRAEPLQRMAKSDCVEVYTSGRFFTFTGDGVGAIQAAPGELLALAEELWAEVNAQKPFELPPRPPITGLSDLEAGIVVTHWSDALAPDEKDDVVDYALNILATKTSLLELEANGGNNSEYYKITTAVAALMRLTQRASS